MAKKTPQKAWNKKPTQKAEESKPMVSLPYLHDDPESVRLRALISKKKVVE